MIGHPVRTAPCKGAVQTRDRSQEETCSAVSSFWIHQSRLFGPFSPIHLLSILTLVGLPRAIWLARQGNIAAHGRLMLILFFFAPVSAGAFTLAPGRLMHAVVFG